MNIVRALSQTGDWTWGQGTSNYISGNLQVAQNISTRLQTFFGECFFATNIGIDWFTLLGGKNQLALNIAVSATILNTTDVTGIIQLSITNTNRVIGMTYQAQTVYSVLSGQFQYDIGGLIT